MFTTEEQRNFEINLICAVITQLLLHSFDYLDTNWGNSFDLRQSSGF